ncbi:hypothetical protein [Pseudomonas reactans]|nr:hypothetical protein [Pseudomonas reactans]
MDYLQSGAALRIRWWQFGLGWGITGGGMEPIQGAKMFAKIVVGILIGFVAGFVDSKGPFWAKRAETILQVLIFLIGLAFLASSFAGGVMYGVMAIAEIGLGFCAYGIVFRPTSVYS